MTVITPRPQRDASQAPAYRIATLLLGIGTVHFLAPKPFDDIIPVAQLGNVSREELTDDNRQAVCSSCHHRKTEATKLAAIKTSAAHRRARLRLPQRPHPGEMR